MNDTGGHLDTGDFGHLDTGEHHLDTGDFEHTNTGRYLDTGAFTPSLRYVVFT